MLKINIDKGRGIVEGRGTNSVMMADMFMVLHVFYNQLDEKSRKTFIKSFDDCRDDIFKVDDDYDKQEQEQEQEHDIDKLINSLDVLKDILKELSE